MASGGFTCQLRSRLCWLALSWTESKLCTGQNCNRAVGDSAFPILLSMTELYVIRIAGARIDCHWTPTAFPQSSSTVIRG